MARTTAAEVRVLLDGATITTLPDATVDVFITAANLLITEVLGSDTDLGATMKTEIEKWFTAHMLASTLWRTTTDEKVGSVSVKYTGKFGLGLDSTPYGQMVKQLDTTGKMGDVGKMAASMYAVISFDNRTYDND